MRIETKSVHYNIIYNKTFLNTLKIPVWLWETPEINELKINIAVAQVMSYLQMFLFSIKTIRRSCRFRKLMAIYGYKKKYSKGQHIRFVPCEAKAISKAAPDCWSSAEVSWCCKYNGNLIYINIKQGKVCRYTCRQRGLRFNMDQNPSFPRKSRTSSFKILVELWLIKLRLQSIYDH